MESPIFISAGATAHLANRVEDRSEKFYHTAQSCVMIPGVT
jgi:hypothetical protein